MLMPDPCVKGPIAAHSAQLAGAMRHLGVDVVIGRWGRHADQESFLDKVLGRARDIRHIRKTLRSDAFDVLLVKTAHDRTALLRDVPLMAVTRGLASRRVVQFHGSLSNELSLPRRWVTKAASRYIVRSNNAVFILSSEECNEWQAFESRGLFHVVANAYVRKREYEGSAARESGSADRRDLVVLFVGRLIAAKGVFDLVEAVSKVRQTVPCRVVLVGDGKDRQALHDLVQSKRLSDSVSMPGHLSGPDLAEAYLNADVFALPSYSEGFPTVLAEAMDAGLPIVTTAIRGAVDRLAEGENALFFPPGRIDLLAEALSRLLLDSEFRRYMGARNREKVKEFSPDVVAREYVRILAAILDAPAERPIR